MTYRYGKTNNRELSARRSKSREQARAHTREYYIGQSGLTPIEWLTQRRDYWDDGTAPYLWNYYDRLLEEEKQKNEHQR